MNRLAVLVLLNIVFLPAFAQEDFICSQSASDRGHSISLFFFGLENQGWQAGIGCFEFSQHLVQVELKTREDDTKLWITFRVSVKAAAKSSPGERFTSIGFTRNSRFDQQFAKYLKPHEVEEASYIVFSSANCEGEEAAACFLRNVAEYVVLNERIGDDRERLDETMSVVENGSTTVLMISDSALQGHFRLFSPLPLEDRVFDSASPKFGKFPYEVTESVTWKSELTRAALAMFESRVGQSQRWAFGSEGASFRASMVTA